MSQILDSRKVFKPVFGIVLFVFMPIYTTWAQLDATVFEDFSQTINNSFLLNPAVKDTSYLFKVRVNAIDEVGLLKYVNRFYFDMDKRIRTSNINSFHYIGIQAFNSKLGQYIQRSRLQFRYAWYTRLSQRAGISAGISLGFINYSLLTTQGGGGGSDFGPDGMLGIQYIRRNTTVGLGVQQIFAPVLIPVNQSFQLNRLYNLDVTHKFTFSPDFHFSVYAVAQLSNPGKLNYIGGVMAEISKYVLVGVNNFSLKKTSFNVGVHRIPFYNTQFSLVATYSLYHIVLPVSSNTIELYLSLQL
ncbi:MAG: type IX secretion system membrane protein PorP/SprF [Cytophagaceae bacterium]